MSMTMTTSATCYASDPSFLKSLAYCLDSTFVGDSAVSVWKIEEFWETAMTGDSTVSPKCTYALMEITTPPTVEYNSRLTFNGTTLVPAATLEMRLKFNYIFDYLEMLQARYASVRQTFSTECLFHIISTY